jgi:hypothetical protein
MASHDVACIVCQALDIDRGGDREYESDRGGGGRGGGRDSFGSRGRDEGRG